MHLLNVASAANRSAASLAYEAALLSHETPVSDAWFDRDIADYAFALVVVYRNRFRTYAKDLQVYGLGFRV